MYSKGGGWLVNWLSFFATKNRLLFSRKRGGERTDGHGAHFNFFEGKRGGGAGPSEGNKA